MHIADQRRTLGAESVLALGVLIQPSAEQALEYRCVRHLVHADINYGCAGLHEFSGDHTGASDGGDENVGAAADSRQVVSLGMTDGDGGVGIEEQHSSWLAHDG